MTRLIRLLGSIQLAVPLLIVIAAVLAWGTIYETRFGTASVQRFIYQAWWFQALLAFLAVNLALAALSRRPWKRAHAPFLLAHLGIICILIGGIIGGRFGVEGQLIIPEGQAERILELPGNVLVVHQPNPGIHHTIPTRFETQAWVHEPKASFPLAADGRTVTLTVDRYYPDAVVNEQITDGGEEENPAIRVRLQHEEQAETMWLLARDPERFGMGWGEAHVLFLEPATDEQLERLLKPRPEAEPPRGVVTLRFEGYHRPVELPVPAERDRTLEVPGTPYQVTFKEYFPDFAITETGLTSRSPDPNNPAVSFTITGPEGTDAYLLFAMHPEIPAMHGWAHRIPVQAAYAHPAASRLPPNAIAVLRAGSNGLAAVLTGAAGERQVIKPLRTGTPYPHPWLGYQFEVEAWYPKARLIQEMTNRSNEVKAEALHVVGTDGARTAEGWVGLRGSLELALGGKDPLTVEYRPAQRELPFTVKLMDFRKIDYPGTQMAAGFEADVQMTDTQRGLILMRKISMNNPLRYRGYSLFQSSYIPGSVETTVLSVRNDPGTPLVYAGFLTVIAGVIAMFITRAPAAPRQTKTARRRRTR